MERNEYKEVKIMRSGSPIRNTYSSNQNLAQFDSNLDYLLEDLQNSVSRPGSSLGHHTNSLNRLTKSANPLTEYSSDDAYTYKSPDGREKVHSYKKEKYIYGKTTSDSGYSDASRTQNSINQLDTLLNDLQQVKKSEFSETFNAHSLEPRQTSRTLERMEHHERKEHREDSLNRRNYEYREESAMHRPVSPGALSNASRTSTLSKKTEVKNIHSYPLEVRETVVPDIEPEVLAHLDPKLRPPGNTKVTTTIKTYTYEIPGSGDYPTNLSTQTQEDTSHVYSPNTSITTPSKSFVYNKVENKENTTTYRSPTPTYKLRKDEYYEEKTVTDNYRPYEKPAPPGGVVVKETITTTNYQPGYSPELNPPTRGQTYMYNETTTTKNVENGYPPASTPRKDVYMLKESSTSTKNEHYAPPPTTNRETYILKESHNTSTVNRNEPSNLPYSERGYPVYNPPEGRGRPNEPININYSYKSTESSKNVWKGEDSQPLLQPHRFPTDERVDGPPKKLDELMATIGNEPPTSPLNVGFVAHEKEVVHQKKIDTLKRQAEEANDMQKKEVLPSKNVSGPPVYYPPGHEMFAKKEESSAGWRAQGEYGKASGKYEYGSESNSKTKTKQGAAVIPVCLPLCCGLPCTLL
ncbi:unnamed protein product [Acanthoscelides obtectus]|uniref:Uncharacterized protein n=1 Tax=Acanthoscelides obtectus TaxID=200917 RepID=A0A9P0KUF4_ACAOB|nr:unnamed protein product [Acanthoscelides obtectus]CAK1660071.1 hypothetical protein AOBTE_LOCUS21853 [Acanthoscelides obtectus]